MKETINGIKREEHEILPPYNMRDTIHTIHLEELNSLAKECNKNVDLIIRKGESKAKEKGYKWYPYWSLKIKAEDGKEVTWSPTKKLILSIIDEFLIHEARVDMTMNRKSDTDVYKKQIDKIILNIQETLRKFEIPDVYKMQKEE